MQDIFQLLNQLNVNTRIFYAGEAMNTFINDNWRHVMKDMKPVLEQTIGEVVKGLFNAIYNKFPLEEILPL